MMEAKKNVPVLWIKSLQDIHMRMYIIWLMVVLQKQETKAFAVQKERIYVLQTLMIWLHNSSFSILPN